MQRFISSTGPVTFHPQDTFQLDLALTIGTDPDTVDNMASVRVLQERVEEIGEMFRNDSVPCEGSFSGIQEAHAPKPSLNVKVYPNPTTDQVWVDLSKESRSIIMEIFNGQGKLVQQKALDGNKVHRVSKLNEKNTQDTALTFQNEDLHLSYDLWALDGALYYYLKNNSQNHVWEGLLPVASSPPSNRYNSTSTNKSSSSFL